MANNDDDNIANKCQELSSEKIRYGQKKPN